MLLEGLPLRLERGVGGEGLLGRAGPLALMAAHLGRALGEEVADGLGHHEGLVGVEAQGLLGQAHLVHAQRGAVAGGGAGLVGRTLADDGVADHERGLFGGLFGLAQGLLDVLEVVAVAGEDAPTVALEAALGVIDHRDVGGALDGDAVGIVKENQLAQTQCAGHRAGLVRDALFQVAVAAGDPRAVIDKRAALGVEARGEYPLGQRHAHARGDALPQGAGGRLHAGRHAALGVAGRPRAQLAELLEVVQGKVEAGQVERRVEQARGVPAGEDEAVAVGPVGFRAADVQVVQPQHGHHIGQAHRHTGVPGIRRLHLVHGQATQGVRRQLQFFRVHLTHRTLTLWVYKRSAYDTKSAPKPQTEAPGPQRFPRSFPRRYEGTQGRSVAVEVCGSAAARSVLCSRGKFGASRLHAPFLGVAHAVPQKRLAEWGRALYHK